MRELEILLSFLQRLVGKTGDLRCDGCTQHGSKYCAFVSGWQFGQPSCILCWYSNCNTSTVR